MSADYKKKTPPKINVAVDDDCVLRDMDNFFKDHLDSSRVVLESTWFRNILYYLGEQWLAWYSTSASFGRRYEINVNIPTPVSNVIRDYVRSEKALILNKRYTTTIWPNSNEQADKDGAEMGVALLENMDAENDGEIEDVKELIILWMLLTGNGIARTYAAADSGNYVVDLNGDPIVNKGCVNTEVIIPFNFRTSPLGLNLRDKAYVGQVDLRDKEEVEDTYHILIKQRESDIEVDYQKQLLTLVANVSPWKGRGIETSMLNKPDKDLVLFREMEFKPTVAYPEGRYVASVAGQVVVNETHLPIPVNKETGAWEYTYTHFNYNLTPGSFWATGGVDDLISPQNTINRIDQALEINRDSFGRPWLMSPAQVTLKRLTSKNQGILAIEYDGQKAMGASPVMQPGTPYPQQILEERNIQVAQAQTAASDPKNVLRGQAPTGSSGIMVDILRETAEQSHAPDIRRFFRSWNRVQRKRLLCAQQVYTETRLLKIRGQGNDVEVKQFKAADLHGNVDVRLELDSGLSSTNVGKNQFLLDLVKGEFWGPIYERPQVQRELLKRLGMGGFPEEDNMHRDRAEHENSLIREKMTDNIAFPGIPAEMSQEINPETGQPDVIEWEVEPGTDYVFRIDNHLIHMQVHEQLILSREFNTLPEQVQAVAIGHYIMHKEAWEADQLQQLAMQEQANMEGNSGEVTTNPTASSSGQNGSML